MSPTKDTTYIERQQFFNGQRLFSDDLQEIEAFNREMRWLHNKSLHQPGIGNGFAMVGKKGDREVIIRPGYAIDGQGQEIVLTQIRIEPVPPVAGDEGRPVLYYLTVSYPDDASLEEAETRQGICGSSGVVRLREEPKFCWIRLNDDGQADNTQSGDDIRYHKKIVLARAEVLNCQLYRELSVTERLSARPAQLPYICCGEVSLEKETLTWAVWDVRKTKTFDSVESLLTVLPYGLRMQINTAECGFLATPCYSVRIEGTRIKRLEWGLGLDSSKVDLIIDGLAQVTQDPEPGQTSFCIEVLLMVQTFDPKIGPEAIRVLNDKLGLAFDAQAEHQTDEWLSAFFKDWKVVWMGVEG